MLRVMPAAKNSFTTIAARRLDPLDRPHLPGADLWVTDLFLAWEHASDVNLDPFG